MQWVLWQQTNLEAAVRNIQTCLSMKEEHSTGEKDGITGHQNITGQHGQNLDILSHLLHRFDPARQGGRKEDAHSFHHFRMEVLPAEAFESSNSTVAVLSVLKIILSHCQPSQNWWKRAIQLADANQFGCDEAVRKIPVPSTWCSVSYASGELKSRTQLTSIVTPAQ